VEDSSAKDALVAQLQDTNNRQQATIHQGEQDMSELRLNMDALERGNADLQVAAAELRVEIHRLQLRRREMQDAFESKEQEIHKQYRNRAARDAAEWREERALLIKESKMHRREIDRRKSDYSRKMDQLSEENLMLRREIDGMKERLLPPGFSIQRR
jgi:cell division protein FtsB